MTIWIILISLLISFTSVNCTEKEFSSCFAHFGCVNFTSEWFDTELRPTNLKPLERHIVNTKFVFLTGKPDTNTVCYDLITTNPLSLKATIYQIHYDLMVLIHDFTSNGYTGWIKHMTLQIVGLERYNIISVDWQEGAEPPFLQAISNARVVALELQQLLSMLVQEFELNLSQVHLIGHGVGAHIAGYVGKALQGHIGRITGLDPTGPCFEGMPPPVRLDYNDSIYVEVLHTDGDGFYHQGTLQPLGNMDFYFNKGAAQPGCQTHDESISLLDVTRAKLKEGVALPDCSHKRAFKYYLQTLQGKSCKFLGLPVGTPENVPIECAAPHDDNVICATVGLDIDTKHYSKQIGAKYEITTQSCTPFCLNRYQIQVDLAKCHESEVEMTGYFIMELEDPDGTQVNLTFNQEARTAQVLLLGQRFTFTVRTTEPIVEDVRHMRLTWHFTTPFCFMCRNATCVEHLSVVHVRSAVDVPDEPFIAHYCPVECSPYIVLYDHVASEQLVPCQNKRT